MYYTKQLFSCFVILFNVLALTSCSQHSWIENNDNGKSKQVTTNSEAEIKRYVKAITYLSTNKLDKAEPILRNFTRDRPALAGPWANLGLIQLKQNNIDKAEKLLKIALTKNPKMAQAFNLLGVIELKRGNISAALVNYTHAVQYKDDYATAHYNLALLYDIYLQDIARAVIHYQRYLTLVDGSDQRTADWLEELKRSLRKSAS